MVPYSAPPAVLFLFAVDAILARWALCHPQLTYSITSAFFLTPLFASALYTRLSGTPNHLAEVEAIFTYLTLTITYLLFFATVSIHSIPATLRVLYGIVLVHLFFTRPEETLLHRLLFVATLCQHAQHLASIAINWSGSFRAAAQRIQSTVTILSYAGLVVSIAADIWGGVPAYYHFALLAAIPHVLPLDLTEEAGLELISPAPFLVKRREREVLQCLEFTPEGKVCDESGLLVAI